MKLSLVIPVYNEKENIPLLLEKIVSVCKTYDYEIICVDDGSSDGSFSVISQWAEKFPSIKGIQFRVNAGQTAALSAGIESATGDIVIPMDADLQNDPQDIPHFIAKLEEGYDVVSGWRKERKDDLFLRKIPSWIANWLISCITDVHLHDYGCSMKAYRRELIQHIDLYGEMHRFIPAYIAWHGGKVTEIVVHHYPRIYGKTKYGISRTFRVILDLIVVKFLSTYMNRPMHFFGGIGLGAGFLGVCAGLTSVVFKVTGYKSMVETPLPILSALLIIIGVQLIVLGVIAEMLTRIYWKGGEKKPYVVHKKINI